MLQAYQGGSDIIVTIDDDNFVGQPDYLGCHAHIGDVGPLEAVSCASGWWNVCELLEDERSLPFYHRGFPLSQRWNPDSQSKRSTITARTVVNAGLWLEDPDIDAVTRLCLPIHVTGTSQRFRERVACGVGTWSPFNSQNTAILREAIAAYFLFPHVGRYDDIWASYVVRKISDYLGDVVTYGSPLVRQKRNVHNYFVDFDAERFGLEHNEIFLEALEACRVTTRTYAEAFAELARQFPDAIARACEAHRIKTDLFARVTEGLNVWSKTIGTAHVGTAAGRS